MRKRHLPLPADAVRGVVPALAIGALICALAGCGGSGHGSGSTTTTVLAGVAGSGDASTSTAATPAAKGHTATTGGSDGDAVRHETHAGNASATSDTGTGTGATAGGHGTTGGAQHGSGTGTGAGHGRGGGGHDVGLAGKPTGGSGKPAGGSGTPASGSSPASSGESGSANATNGVPYEVHTAAMEPTYKPFSTVYYVPTQTHPQVGQVILYYLPAGAEEGTCASPEIGGRACAASTPGLSHTLSLARVVGLAGEQIAVVNGLVVRNGQPVSESSVQPCGEKDLEDEPGCEYPKAITVPAESYYVMADNRLLFQDDSRGFGAVPQAAVVGTLLGS